jgi:hypothetical protein
MMIFISSLLMKYAEIMNSGSRGEKTFRFEERKRNNFEIDPIIKLHVEKPLITTTVKKLNGETADGVQLN